MTRQSKYADISQIAISASYAATASVLLGGTKNVSASYASTSSYSTTLGASLGNDGTGLLKLSNSDGVTIASITSLTASLANNAITSSYTQNHRVIVSSYICQGKLNSDQAIPTSTDTTIRFVDDFDSNNWWDSSAYRFTPTIAGYYNVSIGVWFENMATSSLNQVNTQVRKNGNSFMIIQQPCNDGTGISLNGTKMVYLNGSTDYVDFTAYNGTPNNKNILRGTSDGSGTWFSILLLTQ